MSRLQFSLFFAIFNIKYYLCKGFHSIGFYVKVFNFSSDIYVVRRGCLLYYIYNNKSEVIASLFYSKLRSKRTKTQNNTFIPFVNFNRLERKKTASR